MNIKAFIVALAATSLASTAFAGDPTDVGTDDDMIIPLPDAGGSSVSLPILGSGAGGAGALAIGAVAAAGLIAILDDSSGTTGEDSTASAL